MTSRRKLFAEAIVRELTKDPNPKDPNERAAERIVCGSPVASSVGQWRTSEMGPDRGPVHGVISACGQ